MLANLWNYWVYNPRYWSGTYSQTPAPSGAYTPPLNPYPGPGEQWQVISQHSDLSDAYTACDAAATAYTARVYDSENQSDLYAASPALAASAAAGRITDRQLLSLMTKKDSSAFLLWERARIQLEVWGQVVLRTPTSGHPINVFGAPVTTGFFSLPVNSAAWIAILEVATVRTRTSGQTAGTVAAQLLAWGW
jgi:hypothetical protein